MNPDWMIVMRQFASFLCCCVAILGLLCGCAHQYHCNQDDRCCTNYRYCTPSPLPYTGYRGCPTPLASTYVGRTYVAPSMSVEPRADTITPPAPTSTRPANLSVIRSPNARDTADSDVQPISLEQYFGESAVDPIGSSTPETASRRHLAENSRARTGSPGQMLHRAATQVQ